MSPQCERAIEDALRCGKALLKFISRNDVDVTGAHQSGFYLPKPAWQIFTKYPPNKGTNANHFVKVLWPDGLETESVVKWYGQGTRSEYRLTRFGRDFPWRTGDNLGSLLVLIPQNLTTFIAYVLDLDDDIEGFQAALGVEVIESWAIYVKGMVPEENEDACLNKTFREFAEAVDRFPGVRIFSDTTRTALFDCMQGFSTMNMDDQLVHLIGQEYRLFLMVERKLFQSEVQRLFSSIDDFLHTAQRILQARKSRAGRSLENHVEDILKNAEIRFEMRKIVDGTRPDIIIPSKAAYDDPKYPISKLFMIGVKTTCKDRWRQVIREAPRVKHKHILTLQKGISIQQTREIRKSNVTLVVPKSLHAEYPREVRSELLSVEKFIRNLKVALSDA